MDPDEIKLSGLSKEFAYQKIANELDECNSISLMRDIAKSYAKAIFEAARSCFGFGTSRNINIHTS